MANVRKPIIKNPVYGEILIMLGVHKRHVTEFIEHFELHESKKEQSVLRRQMDLLEEKGFLYSERLKKNNKKIFFINFDKIIDSFIDYALEKKLSDYDFINNKNGSKNKFKKEMNDPNWRKDVKTNRLIQYLFRAFIEETRQCNYDFSIMTLQQLYNAILSTGYLEDKIKTLYYDSFISPSHIEEKIKIIHSNPNKIKKFEDHIKKDLKKEYEGLIKFFDKVQWNKGLKDYIQESFPVEILGILKDGFDKDTCSFYRLNFK